MYTSIKNILERLDAFYGHMKEKAQKSAETIEKVLAHMNVDDAVNPNTCSLADFWALKMYVHFVDPQINCKEEIEKFSPTTVKIAQKVINSCPKIAAFVEKADQTSFGDIFFPRTKSKF